MRSRQRAIVAVAIAACGAGFGAALPACVFGLAPLETGDGQPDAQADADSGADARSDDAGDADARDDAMDAANEASPCGNGVVDPGEECDDKTVYCAACKIVCADTTEFQDMTTRHCYRVPETKLGYDEARNDCLGTGADLAVVKSKSEILFVDENTAGGLFSEHMTIGARRANGTWHWVDGSTLDLGGPLWDPGEPNGVDGDAGAYCVALNRADGGGYTDSDCNALRNYLCEYPPPPGAGP